MNTNYLKDFVPKKQALALKKLGFDEPCLMAYLGKEKEPYLKCDDTLHLQAKDVLNPLKTPTYSQAFRWFREKHLIFSSILPFQDIEDNVGLCYYYCVIELYECSGEDILCNETSLGASDSNFPSPEEAELECLKKLIEIVKKQL